MEGQGVPEPLWCGHHPTVSGDRGVCVFFLLLDGGTLVIPPHSAS